MAIGFYTNTSTTASPFYDYWNDLDKQRSLAQQMCKSNNECKKDEDVSSDNKLLLLLEEI